MQRTAFLRRRRGSQTRSLAAGALLLALPSLVTQAGSAQQPGGAAAARAPNRLGRIPILEYHLVGDTDSRWGRSRERFRRDLQLLYDRGYRPITVAQLVDGDIDIPAGTSPVVFTFDDASPGQLRFVERNGKPELDPQSAVGIWLDFSAKHPDWKPRATFCLLSAASAGHAFFGDRGIDGQKTEWRFAKLRLLKEKGFELCGHTLWHANLGTLSDAGVQEQIARGVMAIDSAVPGYQVRTFALPLGVWPKNRALARAGSWKDPKTGRVVSYRFDAILEVSGPAARSPHDPAFNALSLPRIQVVGDDLEKTLDRLDRENQRYVADGARAAR